MKQPRIYVYTDNGNEMLRNIDIVISAINGISILDSNRMTVLINGVDHVFEYNAELYEEVMKNINVINLMNRN